MYHLSRALIFLSVVFIISCSSSSKESSQTEPDVQNETPISIVAKNFLTLSNSSVLLDGRASKDNDGGIVSYKWNQTLGTPTVSLTNNSSSVAGFTAPTVSSDTPLTFQLVVTDNRGATDSSSVIVTIQAPSTQIVTAAVISSRTTCTAPCGIMFDATSSTSTGVTEPFHELDYSWDYGDVGSSFIQRPTVNANQSSSPIGAHVYQTAGTFTTTLTVTGNGGGTNTQTIDIVVQDPNNTFAVETYCVSNSNNFVNCPTQDSIFHFTSFASAATFMGNLRFNQASRPTRILFRAGDTFTAANQYTIRNLTAALQVSSYGAGNKPIIAIDPSMAAPTLFFIHDSSDISISQLNFVGNYKPASGTGNHPTAIWFYLGVSHALVYQNQFSGLGMNVYPHGGKNISTGAVSQFEMIVDNQMSNWLDYGLFGNFGYLGALLANTIKQDINAVSGSESKCGSCVPNYPDHGPIRNGYSDHLLIQYNDMFNNAGWSSGGLAHQPNIRLGTGGISIKSVIADNILEGGFTTISMTPANPGAGNEARRADVIIERNQLTASGNTWQMIDMGMGGAVIRNNLFLKPNNGAPPIGSGSFQAAIVFKVGDDRNSTENLSYTNRIYNNTLISNAQTSAPSLNLIEVDNNFTRFEINSNLAYLPYVLSNGDSGLLSWNYAGLLDSVSSDNNLVYSPNNTNFTWNNGVSLDLGEWQLSGNDLFSYRTDPLLSDSNNFDAHLLLNSPAINNGKALSGLLKDFTNQPRVDLPDIGSFEF